MSYADLYKYCQGLEAPISRKQLIPKVCELTKLPEPKVCASGLDPQVLLGFICFPGERTDHPYAQWMAGRPLIVVGREIDPDKKANKVWQRLVVIKELMHYFDSGIETVSSPEDFEGVAAEINIPLLRRSPAMHSEIRGLWMALGVVCPELLRQRFQRELETGEIDYAKIGAILRMPEEYVPHLFDPRFKNELAELIDC